SVLFCCSGTRRHPRSKRDWSSDGFASDLPRPCGPGQKTAHGPEAWLELRRGVFRADPACGAGALLVAFANECLRQKVNYQTSVLFVAQDIDFTVGLMCYIQLSLLGCAGYVVIGDTLVRPSTA